MPPDEPTEEERLEQLDQDGQTPFAPPDPLPGSDSSDLPDDHQATDTNIDKHELYDEGISGAAEVEDKSSQTAVTDYTPPAPADDANVDDAL